MKRRTDLSSGLLAKKEPEIVKTGLVKILAVTGSGAPEAGPFTEAIGALYALAWSIKMTRKASTGDTFKVPPVEAFWWGAKPSELARNPEGWHWKVFLRVPSWVTARDLRAAKTALHARGRPEGTGRVKLELLDEGTCVQVLHVGPYSAEGTTIRRMERFAHEHGLSFTGKHHEIYFSDPRRTAPEKLRTTLRHAVRPA